MQTRQDKELEILRQVQQLINELKLPLRTIVNSETESTSGMSLYFKGREYFEFTAIAKLLNKLGLDAEVKFFDTEAKSNESVRVLFIRANAENDFLFPASIKKEYEIHLSEAKYENLLERLQSYIPVIFQNARFWAT